MNDIENSGGTVRQYRPLIYVCSDVDEGGAERTEEFCRFALKKGQIPLASDLLFSRLMPGTAEEDRELRSFMDIVLMGKCEEVWVLTDSFSREMRTQIGKAVKRRQKVRYFNSRFEEVFPG